jgi:UDP-N-acetylglucosamine 2-epimerase (non-hydrolysing)
MTSSITVFIGTKAQYIKTAPVLRELDERGVPYRLIDSGQHAALSADLRRELSVREPDVTLGASGRDITSIPQALRWSLRLAARLLDRRRLARELFADEPGVCLVHGDTPSTLLATLMARRAGLRVAHLEAGLRADSLLHPFPEEAIRRVVMRVSHILFAPDEQAVDNLPRQGLAARTVRTSGNTVSDALEWSLGDTPVDGQGPVIATCHRVENLHRRERLHGFLRLVRTVADDREVTFVAHGPTIAAVAPHREHLDAAGVQVEQLVPHAEFTRLLARAPFVITDGGSIQEECALLGIPTLLWRGGTERPDGIGRNVVVSGYDRDTIRRFLAEPGRLRVEPVHRATRPSAEIVDHLLAVLGR